MEEDELLALIISAPAFSMIFSSNGHAPDFEPIFSNSANASANESTSLDLKIEFLNYLKKKVMILRDIHIFIQNVAKKNFWDLLKSQMLF